MEIMDTRYAVVNENNIVENMIMASIDDIPPLNCFLVELMNDQWCDIGAVWDGESFAFLSNTSEIV